MSDEETAGRDTDPVEQDGVSEEKIRQRAYEISQSADAGSPEENWERARQELERKQ